MHDEHGVKTFTTKRKKGGGGGGAGLNGCMQRLTVRHKKLRLANQSSVST